MNMQLKQMVKTGWNKLKKERKNAIVDSFVGGFRVIGNIEYSIVGIVGSFTHPE